MLGFCVHLEIFSGASSGKNRPSNSQPRDPAFDPGEEAKKFEGGQVRCRKFIVVRVDD